MAISDKLTQLQNDIESAYSSIQIKGGTIPNNKNTNNLASAIINIPSGSSTTDKEKATLQSLVERKASTYTETFNYDNEVYSVIDSSLFDDDETYRIKNIGQRAFNSFANATHSIRIKMPKYLESISGSNWHGATRVSYYDFSNYKGDTVPLYTSTTTNLGNSSAIVLVPKRLETAWKTATGWASFATQIIGVEEEYN